MLQTLFTIIYFSFCGVGFLWVSHKLWRYAKHRQNEALRLLDEGWLMIGCNFLLGPVMVPPEAVMPEDLAKKWRESHKKSAMGLDGSRD